MSALDLVWTYIVSLATTLILLFGAVRFCGEKSVIWCLLMIGGAKVVLETTWFYYSLNNPRDQNGEGRGNSGTRRPSRPSQGRSPRSQVTTPEDVETKRTGMRQLARGIKDSKAATGACLEVQMTCLSAERELEQAEAEHFSEHDFANRARSEAASCLRNTREICEQLINRDEPLDGQLVALLGRLLLAERACRECDTAPEDGECGALAVLSQIEIETSGKKG